MDRNMGVGTTRDRRGVALRKESVDRNLVHVRNRQLGALSLSARRAWIEINVGFPIAAFLLSRSPQGERG